MRLHRILLPAFASAALLGGSGVAGTSVLAYSVPDSQYVSSLTLRRHDAAVELRDARGALLASRPLRDTSAVLVEGARRGRDTLTIDLRGGPLALPGGVVYDGGREGFDSLNLDGGSPGALHYRATSPGAGTITAGKLRVSFSNLEPVNLTGTGASPLFVEATDPDVTTLTLADNGVPGDGVNRIFAPGIQGFETVAFSGYGSVVLYGGDGADSITIAGVDPADPDGAGQQAPLTSITATGDNSSLTDLSADTLEVGSLPAGVSTTVLGGGGNDTFLIGSPSLDGVLGPLSIDGGANDSTGAGQVMTCPSGSFARSVVSGDVVLLNDANNGGGGTWSITSSSASRSGSSLVSYSDVETLQAQGGGGVDQFNVASTGDSARAQLMGGDGDDSFSVTSTGVASLVSLDGESGAADFTVQSTGADSLLAASGGTGADSLVQNGNGANGGVSLHSGPGGDTIAVHGSSAGSLTGHDGDGSDTVTVDGGQGGTVCGSAVTAARSVRASATVSGRTVTLRWRVANTAGTLGFDVYRQDGAWRVRLNRALLTGTPTAGGRAYVWRDRAPRGATSFRYWLQEVQPDGVRTWHGPVAATLRA